MMYDVRGKRDEGRGAVSSRRIQESPKAVS